MTGQGMMTIRTMFIGWLLVCWGASTVMYPTGVLDVKAADSSSTDDFTLADTGRVDHDRTAIECQFVDRKLEDRPLIDHSIDRELTADKPLIHRATNDQTFDDQASDNFAVEDNPFVGFFDLFQESPMEELSAQESLTEESLTEESNAEEADRGRVAGMLKRHFEEKILKLEDDPFLRFYKDYVFDSDNEDSSSIIAPLIDLTSDDSMLSDSAEDDLMPINSMQNNFARDEEISKMRKLKDEQDQEYQASFTLDQQKYKEEQEKREALASAFQAKMENDLMSLEDAYAKKWNAPPPLTYQQMRARNRAFFEKKFIYK